MENKKFYLPTKVGAQFIAYLIIIKYLLIIE